MVAFRDNECEAYLFNLSRLWDVIAFLYCWLCWVRFQWSHCVNSAHVNPWLLGLSDGTKARGLSREPVAVPVRGGGSGVTLTSAKTTLISNTCLCLPQPSLVSLRQHCALFPVAMETRCVHKLQTVLFSVATLDKILHPMLRKHHQSLITRHGLFSYRLYISAHFTHTHTGCPELFLLLLSCLALWPSVLNDLFGFVGWNQSAVSAKELTRRPFCFCPVECVCVCGGGSLSCD